MRRVNDKVGYEILPTFDAPQARCSSMASSPASIPTKITPDGLTDAIVAVQYTTYWPAEVALGFFWQAFTELGFIYNAVEHEGNALSNGARWFKREGILLQFTPNLLLFNGVSRPADSLQWQEGASGYIGWQTFLPIILEVLDGLAARKLVKAYQLVGIRYINVLPWPDLNKQLTVQLPTLPATFQAVEQFQYRATTTTTDNYRVAIQLADLRLPREDRTGALFDVEVWAPNPVSDYDQIPTLLEQVHQKQKELFFGLLSKEFLATLDPQY